jgi:hypothetical protein
VQAGIGAVHILDWASMMDRDPRTRRWFGAGGRPRQEAIAQKLIWYDELEDRWAARDNWSGVEGGHMYRATTVLPEHRRVAYVPLGTPTIELWDIDDEHHAGSIPKPPSNIGGFTNAWMGATFICWFPTMGTQGSLVWANDSRDRICRFDWAEQRWTALGSLDGTWDNLHFGGHFHPVTGKMILGASTFESQSPLAIVDANGSIGLTAPAPCSTICGGTTRGMFFPHPSRAASIVFCHNTKRIWSYEWAADLWVDRGPVPPEVDSVNVIALPTDSGALIARYRSNGGSTTHVWRPDF